MRDFNPTSARNLTPHSKRQHNALDTGLLLLVCLMLALKFRLLQTMSINQDEFFYFGHVASYLRGTLTQPLQTLHIHFFTWLLPVENEVAQIVRARMSMFAVFAATCALTYSVGRRFIGRTGALFSVLCYVSFTYVAGNGAAFRADTLSLFLFLIALSVSLNGRFQAAAPVIAGIALAASLLFTIKALIHVAMIALVIACQPSARGLKLRMRDLLLFCVSLSMSVGVFYGIHSTLIPEATVRGSFATVDAATAKTLAHRSLFPQLDTFLIGIWSNPVFWLIFGLGLILLSKQLVRLRLEGRAQLLLTSFAIPLVTLAFYRNSFPYYYVFILTPAVLICGALVDKLLFESKRKNLAVAIISVMSLLLCLKFIWMYGAMSQHRNSVQRTVLEVVHRSFPKPVPYIDGSSMVSSFPQTGFFMSSWGMEGYRARGEPIMKQRLVEKQPLFVLANVPQLNLSLSREKAIAKGKDYGLLDADWEILKANFVPFWGILFVAGKVIQIDPGTDTKQFEILIGGDYELVGGSKVLLNDSILGPGESTYLEPAKHRVSSTDGPLTVTLRVRTAIETLPEEVPADSVFAGSFR